MSDVDAIMEATDLLDMMEEERDKALADLEAARRELRDRKAAHERLFIDHQNLTERYAALQREASDD